MTEDHEAVVASGRREDRGDQSLLVLERTFRAPAVDVWAAVTEPERLERWIGPYLEPIAVGALVLVLVLFLLMSREDLSDRIVQLFGLGRISLTTRTMEDVAHRISRYLAIFSTSIHQRPNPTHSP